MFASTRSRVLSAAAPILMLLILPSCSKETTKPEPPPVENPRATKMGVISLLAQCLEERDIEEYQESFHPDYEFWFCEDDVRDPCWDWTDRIDLVADVAVTYSMFRAESVVDIGVEFVNLSVVGDSTGFLEYEEVIGTDTVTVYWAEFGVDLHVVEDIGDGDIDHWVDGRAYMHFCADPNNDHAWTIWKIEDRGNEHRKGQGCTWSGLKALFKR